jgi:hypothetical protein
LAHIGSFLSERNPAILWESLVELLSEVSDFKRTYLEIKLIGAVSQEVLETIAQFDLDPYLNNLDMFRMTKQLPIKKIASFVAD